jgi:transcriptional regulator with XRE-family HTH domain
MSRMERTTFGKLVKARRQRLGLTQREFGNKLGKQQPYISRVESGGLIPSLLDAYEISKMLNISMNRLCKGLG